MTIPRFYVSSSTHWRSGDRLDLPNEVIQHIQARRLTAGNTVQIFCGYSEEYVGILLSKQGSSQQVEIETVVLRPLPRMGKLVLAVSPPANERMDWLVEKATELGATHIQTILSRRSVFKLHEDKQSAKLSRWQRIAISACEQSGRSLLPNLQLPMDLLKWLQQPPVHGEGYFFLDPNAKLSLASALRQNGCQNKVLLIGPEGGWSEEERQSILQSAYQPVHVGPHILRTETAALTALSLSLASVHD
ncbi:MAG: 16S rRNA (uracil(1498)-N(3))-methyltransferase [Gammaproteobacteria bacterium]|nr:16S rRNA (uracil(1498)-N(3))-methyltransferase [Gammaproteobacteria bacterium]